MLIRIRKFWTLTDAMMWAIFDAPRPCSKRTPSDECDEGRPCIRHAHAPQLGAALWRRQQRRTQRTLDDVTPREWDEARERLATKAKTISR